MLMEGKTALVTGAANGIGAEIARLFCEQGARVWLLDKDEKELKAMTNSLREQGAQADLCVADVTKPREIEGAIAQIHKQIDGLDVLVNNAGIYPRRQFLEMEEADWLTVLDVNLNSAYRCTRLVVPQMVQRRRGKVVRDLFSHVSLRIEAPDSLRCLEGRFDRVHPLSCPRTR